MPESYRIFAAVPLPETLKNTIHSWCRRQKQAHSFQKWVHEGDYHITLKFIGEQPSSRVAALSDAIRQAAAEHRSFNLQLKGAGFFGPPRAPSILWLGVEGETSILSALQAGVEGGLANAGVPAEAKPFRAHITLARRYKGQEPWNPEVLRATSPPEGEWRAERIVLYRTRMGQAPMYEELESFPLGNRSE